MARVASVCAGKSTRLLLGRSVSFAFRATESYDALHTVEYLNSLSGSTHAYKYIYIYTLFTFTWAYTLNCPPKSRRWKTRQYTFVYTEVISVYTFTGGYFSGRKSSRRRAAGLSFFARAQRVKVQCRNWMLYFDEEIDAYLFVCIIISTWDCTRGTSVCFHGCWLIGLIRRH